jgi:hypothetical protein
VRKDVRCVEIQDSFLKPQRGDEKREALQSPVVRRIIEGVLILIGGIMIGIVMRVFPERTPPKPERELLQSASIEATIADLHLPPEMLTTRKESAEGQRQQPQPLSEEYRNVEALGNPAAEVRRGEGGETEGEGGRSAGRPLPRLLFPSYRTLTGGVSDLDTVILNPEDSQYVKATYIHIWNTTRRS